MRVLLVGPAPGAGGGVSAYLDGLASALAARKLDVWRAGSGDVVGDYDISFLPRWHGSVAESGVANAFLRNPRSANVHYGHPFHDIHNADISSWRKLLTHVQPDVVHVHSVTGAPFQWWRELPDSVQLVVSVHEYFGMCQQGTLVQSNGARCETYDQQSQCEACVPRWDLPRARVRAFIQNAANGRLRGLPQLLEKATGREFEVGAASAIPDQAPPSLPLANQLVAQEWQERSRYYIDGLNERADAVLVVSRDVANVLEGLGLEPGRAQVEHIGSQGAEVLPSRPPLAIDNGAQSVTLLFPGGYTSNKGGLEFVRAVSAAPSAPRAIVIGDGHDAYRAAMEAAAGPNVEFRGRFDRETLASTMAESDVVVLTPTGPDTSPQTVFEAFQSGRPVIGLDFGGIPDFVSHEHNGLLVPPGDHEALVAAIERLCEPGLARRLSASTELPQTVEGHAAAVAARYEGLLSQDNHLQG